MAIAGSSYQIVLLHSVRINFPILFALITKSLTIAHSQKPMKCSKSKINQGSRNRICQRHPGKVDHSEEPESKAQLSLPIARIMFWLHVEPEGTC
jgi:hypothetical protein